MEEEIIYFYKVKDGKYYQSRYTHRWLNNLQQQCKKQKEVIDKAIEWVKDWRRGANDWFEEDSKPSELLDILNEVTNNE